MVSKKEDKRSRDLRNSPLEHDIHIPNIEAVRSVLHIPKHCKLSESAVCGGLTYILLASITIVLALAAIVITGVGAVTQKVLFSGHTGREVAMIILIVIAAVTIGLSIYSIVGVHKKQSKPLFSTAIALAVLALIQALILGLSVHVTQKAESGMVQELVHSFLDAKEGQPDDIQYWNNIQSELECCGVYSPEDYRNPGMPKIFLPPIPASCCPTLRDAVYNNVSRDREREACKVNLQFYKVGCKKPILTATTKTAESVVIVTIVLIVVEVALAILAAVLSSKRTAEKQEQIDVPISQISPTQLNASNTPSNNK